MNFELPYAVGPENKLVGVLFGQKGVVYKCPGCFEKVLFRQGDVYAAHFAHYPNVSCSKEAVLERIGQSLFLDILNEKLGNVEKPSRPFPRLNWICEGPCKALKEVTLPAQAVRAIPDPATPSTNAKIMLVDQMNNPVMMVSIKGIRHDGHEVSADIRGIPWIIVDGLDILGEGTSWFVASSQGHEDCPQCIAIKEKQKKDEQALLERLREEQSRLDKEQAQKDAARTAEYEKYIASLSGKPYRPNIDHVGEWGVGGFTWLLKPRVCPVGHRTHAWIWPDGKSFGEVPIDPDKMPPNLVRVEETNLFASRCRECGTALTT